MWSGLVVGMDALVLPRRGAVPNFTAQGRLAIHRLARAAGASETLLWGRAGLQITRFRGT